MILKIVNPPKISKMWRFLLKLLLAFPKNWIITLVFEKNANLVAENWRKTQKIKIKTSTHRLLYTTAEKSVPFHLALVKRAI
jgi:hypothetical protein